MKIRGSVAIIVVAAIAVGGLFLWLFKPAALHGDSKRANASTDATAGLVAAANAQSAAAAASVVKIGEANGEAPASPAKDFISREVPLALTFLSPPDAARLVEAERRKVAVMSGQLDEVRKLYGEASKNSAKLQSERDAALAARQAVDTELQQVAAARLAAEHQRSALAVGVALLVILYVYTKFYSISPATLGKIAADVRGGGSAIAAMNTHLAPWLHARVRTASKLATEPKD
jgi:hypothetical protein